MKVTIEIDCTHEEARDFLGLPDVKPLHDEVMGEIRNRMLATVKTMDPAEMWKDWMPGASGYEQMQDFFALMTGAKRGK